MLKAGHYWSYLAAGSTHKWSKNRSGNDAHATHSCLLTGIELRRSSGRWNERKRDEWRGYRVTDNFWPPSRKLLLGLGWSKHSDLCPENIASGCCSCGKFKGASCWFPLISPPGGARVFLGTVVVSVQTFLQTIGRAKQHWTLSCCSRDRTIGDWFHAHEKGELSNGLASCDWSPALACAAQRNCSSGLLCRKGLPQPEQQQLWLVTAACMFGPLRLMPRLAPFKQTLNILFV